MPDLSSLSEVTADIEIDVVKITVINGYKNTLPAVALIQNFGFKRGAIASSVAHDSHKIVAVEASNRGLFSAKDFKFVSLWVN
jgi:adenine deaminase